MPVLIVDVIIVLVLLGALVAGLTRGLVAGLGVLVGLAAGGFAAAFAAPWVTSLIPDPTWRTVGGVGVWVVLVGVGAALGGAVGGVLRAGVDRTPLRVVDRLAGGVVALAVTGLVVSLAGTGIATAGVPGVSAAVGSSRAMQAVDAVIPEPIDALVDRARATLAADALPALRDLLHGPTPEPQAPVDLDGDPVRRAAASVARISGNAYACGESLTGSGFAVGPDLVVTNAHVVAGVDTPVVQMPGGTARDGTIVSFDPRQDLAVIRADGLGATPLDLGAALRPGAAAVVAGYPLGGPLRLGDATVVSAGQAAVPDVQGTGTTVRSLYRLRADVQPGNSGGPLLDAAGHVAGVVFARDEAHPDVGYALSVTTLAPLVQRAARLHDTVPSGTCSR